MNDQHEHDGLATHLQPIHMIFSLSPLGSQQGATLTDNYKVNPAPTRIVFGKVQFAHGWCVMVQGYLHLWCTLDVASSGEEA